MDSRIQPCQCSIVLTYGIRHSFVSCDIKAIFSLTHSINKIFSPHGISIVRFHFFSLFSAHRHETNVLHLNFKHVSFYSFFRHLPFIWNNDQSRIVDSWLADFRSFVSIYLSAHGCHNVCLYSANTIRYTHTHTLPHRNSSSTSLFGFELVSPRFHTDSGRVVAICRSCILYCSSSSSCFCRWYSVFDLLDILFIYTK